MTSTYLHGLDDEDIPEGFHDELNHAQWMEWRPDTATLLNALLLAGWVPPSETLRAYRAVRDVAEEIESRRFQVAPGPDTMSIPPGVLGQWTTKLRRVANGRQQ